MPSQKRQQQKGGSQASHAVQSLVSPAAYAAMSAQASAHNLVGGGTKGIWALAGPGKARFVSAKRGGNGAAKTQAVAVAPQARSASEMLALRTQVVGGPYTQLKPPMEPHRMSSYVPAVKLHNPVQQRGGGKKAAAPKKKKTGASAKGGAPVQKYGIYW
jgi:hypothetical protein